jgi:hypothetical protein
MIANHTNFKKLKKNSQFIALGKFTNSHIYTPNMARCSQLSNLEKQKKLNLAARMPPPLIWHIFQIIVECFSLVI